MFNKLFSRKKMSNNTGSRNTGNGNTGWNNAGDNNTGHNNTGHGNTGNGNTGWNNAGDNNTGNNNTGHRNTGSMNTGNNNTGHRNTGSMNTGNNNTGNRNTGNMNTGNNNTGNRNTGFFNTDAPTVRLFNRDSELSFDSKEIRKLDYLCSVMPSISYWVDKEDMTDAEKVENPDYYVAGGFLKQRTMYECWQKGWSEFSKEDKDFIKSLPNFDADIFKEITGIDVREKSTRVIIIDGKEIKLSGESYNELKKSLIDD